LVPDYRTIVKRYGPAVVGVRVSGMHDVSREEGAPSAEMDPFFQFFRGMPNLQGRGLGTPQTPFKGQGSGFIISEDGLILTNAHVVRDAKEVMVHLSDRREFAAKVLGADPATDVAVLRIQAHGLPTVALGSLANVEVGDRVLAIGAPYGLEQTATQGIISAKGRSLPGESVVPFLQTDAAVNPGNSGGPLFDGQGRVVGINAQIYTESGGFQGLSFAIPMDVALKVKDQLVATGKVAHARLGVAVQDLTQPLAESFGLPRPDGALVAQVQKGSAAAKAGLRAGDVITQVDGEAVVRSAQVSSTVGLAKPGDVLKLKVWRDHAWTELSASLDSADGAADSVQGKGAVDASSGQLGMAVRPLTAQERSEAEVAQGLLVEGVSGPAARAGVETGDVLLAVNGQPVQSVEGLKAHLRDHPKTLALLVLRDHQQIFVPVKLS
jgi:serine protease Do